MSEVTFKSDVEVRLIDRLGSDDDIAAAAKVLDPEAHRDYLAEPGKGDAVAGLIGYMMRHRHGTPFEHGCVRMYVSAPIFVWREWHRHRVAWSYNEESARYKVLAPVFYLPPRDRPMMKVDGWRAGRPKFLRCDSDESYAALCMNLEGSYRVAYRAYEANLALGVDPGLARDCLPVGTYSSCWVTCNPRSLMAFLSLRLHEPAAKFVSYPLWEMERAARACEAILREGWPITHRAFVENGWVGP